MHIVIIFLLCHTGCYSVFATNNTLPPNKNSFRRTIRFRPGTSDFAELVKTDGFIDKTLMIKEFFNQDYVLVTAPPKFGKTTNMDMLRRFCEVKVDATGQPVPINFTENFKIYEKGYRKIDRKVCFQIFKYKVTYNRHLGSYPVIHADFKNLRVDSYQTFINSFRSVVANVFTPFEYLLKSDKINQVNLKMLNVYYDRILAGSLTEDDVLHSFHFLSKLLYSHFEKKIILFVDDYDAVVQKGIFENSPDLLRILRFMLEFTSVTLKSNNCVTKALLNGCTNFLGNLGYHANNIQQKPFLDSAFSPYYGFTEQEVKLLLKRMKLEKTFNRVKRYYGGYETRSARNTTIYNPFSIVSYVESKRIENYWLKSGDMKNTEKVHMCSSVQHTLGKLSTGNQLARKDFYVRRLHVNDVIELRDIINTCQNTLDKKPLDLFIQFMVDLGYYNLKRVCDDEVIIRIPNREIENEFKTMYV